MGNIFTLQGANNGGNIYFRLFKMFQAFSRKNCNYEKNRRSLFEFAVNDEH